MEGHQQPQHYSWKSSWDAQHCTYKPPVSVSSFDWIYFMQFSWLLMSLHCCMSALGVHWIELWEEIVPCVCACVFIVYDITEI